MGNRNMARPGRNFMEERDATRRAGREQKNDADDYYFQTARLKFYRSPGAIEMILSSLTAIGYFTLGRRSIWQLEVGA